MRGGSLYWFLFLFLFLLTTCHPPILETTGRVLQTEAYCGGAHPPRGLIEELRTPSPLEGVKVYALEGKVNNFSEPFAEAVTSADGGFVMELEEGTYCMITEEKRELPDDYGDSSYGVNKTCLEERWMECDAVVQAGEKVEIVLHKSCFYNRPCRYCKNPPCALPS